MAYADAKNGTLRHIEQAQSIDFCILKTDLCISFPSIYNLIGSITLINGLAPSLYNKRTNGESSNMRYSVNKWSLLHTEQRQSQCQAAGWRLVMVS